MRDVREDLSCNCNLLKWNKATNIAFTHKLSCECIMVDQNKRPVKSPVSDLSCQAGVIEWNEATSLNVY